MKPLSGVIGLLAASALVAAQSTVKAAEMKVYSDPEHTDADFRFQAGTTPADPIRAFCIDFNWGEGGPNGFARPGLWAEANLFLRCSSCGDGDIPCLQACPKCLREPDNQWLAAKRDFDRQFESLI